MEKGIHSISFSVLQFVGVFNFIFLTVEQSFPQPGELLISLAAFLMSLFWIISIFPEGLYLHLPGEELLNLHSSGGTGPVCLVKNAVVSHIAIG